ncbi:MAG: hypothetical protein KAG66_04505 [Methylococcales bacterium]|nr:hypothetical protein [Methylococcales bacterium]
MSVIVKRYPNRKLYNTTTKRNITLDGIAKLIRSGEDVQIQDHKSGEDLTSLTLSQIIFEQEKKRSGFLPKAVLTSLIQTGGETINTIRRTLGVPDDWRVQIDEEIERRVQSLVKQGDVAQEEGSRLLDKLLAFTPLSSWKRADDEAESDVVVDEVDEPATTNDQIKALFAQLDVLTAKLDKVAKSAETKDDEDG